MTRVSAVVPCRNEADTILRLLEALALQQPPPDEIVVVDDRSSDDTAACVRAWCGPVPVRLVPGPGRGVAAALNAGIGVATGAIIARFDGHSWPDPDYLRRARTALERDATLGVVGGVWRIVPARPSRVARAIAAVVSHPVGSGGAAYRHASPPSPQVVETVPFGVFPRSLWEALGGYDEGLGANEDYEFNDRVRQSGRSVVLLPGLVSTYVARPTLGTLAHQYSRYGFWKQQMVRRRPAALHLRQVIPALLVPGLVASLGLAWLGWWQTLLVPAVYGLALLLASADVARQARSPGLWLPALAAFVVVHISWSSGWWVSSVSRRRGRPRT